MEEIEKTALWVAGIRALESERENPLFRDLFAHRLVDEPFLADLRHENANNSLMPPAIEVRTRWLDDEITLAMEDGIRQVVILAAGMDARAYRLTWPKDTHLYELDRVNVLRYKDAKLAEFVPKCVRFSLAVDLQQEWVDTLKNSGFSLKVPTLWLIEGLLCYLSADQVTHLFSLINSLSVKNSIVLFDAIGRSMLESSNVKVLHDLARRFGTDQPETLLMPLGWEVTAHTTAAIGYQLGRWPFPVYLRGTPGVPQSFLVHAAKI